MRRVNAEKEALQRDTTLSDSPERIEDQAGGRRNSRDDCPNHRHSGASRNPPTARERACAGSSADPPTCTAAHGITPLPVDPGLRRGDARNGRYRPTHLRHSGASRNPPIARERGWAGSSADPTTCIAAHGITSLPVDPGLRRGDGGRGRRRSQIPGQGAEHPFYKRFRPVHHSGESDQVGASWSRRTPEKVAALAAGRPNDRGEAASGSRPRSRGPGTPRAGA